MPDAARIRLEGTSLKALVASTLSGLMLMLAGCSEQEAITQYTVAKPPPFVAPESSATHDADSVMPLGMGRGSGSGELVDGRLIGAIVPHGERTWFFKLTGPARAVTEQVDQFRQFIKSLKFVKDEAKWTLPEGWREEEGTGIRVATIRIDADGAALELSVIPLATGPGDEKEYLLQNINRWREQLGREKIGADDLTDQTARIEFDGGAATVVTFTGKVPDTTKPKSDGTGSGSDHGSGRDPRTARPDFSSLPLTFDAPEGWTPKPAGPMRMAEWMVKEDDKQVVVSISTAGGDLNANVNRWRGQIGMDDASASELNKLLRKLTVDGNEGTYAELVGPEKNGARQAILGVIVPTGDRQWFFKMQGDAGIASKEQKQFEAFVKSVKFRK